MRDDRLERAVADKDTAGIVSLYREQAAQAPGAEAEAFYLTHAYVWALEAGLPTEAILSRLRALGAEP